MDGVGISIIERPRPLHNHDTPNPTHHTYTLKCEEPLSIPHYISEGLQWLEQMTTESIESVTHTFHHED